MTLGAVTRTCCDCGTHNTIMYNYVEIWYKCKCKEKGCTEYLCNSCYGKHYYIKIIKPDHCSLVKEKKAMADSRVGTIDKNCTTGIANNSRKLACKLYEWDNLSVKYNNYNYPLNCYAPKTGLYHQVKMSYYNPEKGSWAFAEFEKQRKKIFESMICFCMSTDKKMVERIYKFPKIIVEEKNSVAIIKKLTEVCDDPVIIWYEKYRCFDKDELKKANDIWNGIFG